MERHVNHGRHSKSSFGRQLQGQLRNSRSGKEKNRGSIPTETVGY